MINVDMDIMDIVNVAAGEAILFVVVRAVLTILVEIAWRKYNG